MDVVKLRSVGIDANEGLAYCADDEEFYEEMLDEYVHESRAKLEELNTAFGLRDWERYRISAHSLKSTSRMVGAKGISGKAYEGKSLRKRAMWVRLSPCIPNSRTSARVSPMSSKTR